MGEIDRVRLSWKDEALKRSPGSCLLRGRNHEAGEGEGYMLESESGSYYLRLYVEN